MFVFYSFLNVNFIKKFRLIGFYKREFCKACTPIVRVLVFCKNSQKTKKNKI
ncbi:hypothetical protein AcetOrient_orf02812 [Acetobacter orientalis]|uniref:Uncharacterized protein n=1 Tax=Acetobacter orientalis TaxID=146474 RepID=A0A2Z5ZHK2_9PROT|nr:hypothetical protein AcetOrient_orf02812 [Acetobacter orientalis]